jgi:endonuclease/exonuclease/phosphatase family metal-dependent hydrolase
MQPFTPRLYMFSSRLLDHVFVSRVSQTRENIRGVKGSMFSSRLLDHVFVSCVSKTRHNIRGVKVSMLSSRLLDHVFVSPTFIVSGLTHTGHEHII